VRYRRAGHVSRSAETYIVKSKTLKSSKRKGLPDLDLNPSFLVFRKTFLAGVISYFKSIP
jgi:hypothetical protein